MPGALAGSWRKRRRVMVFGAGLGLLAIAAFQGGRVYVNHAQVTASQPFDPASSPDTTQPNWYVPWFEWEALQPKVEATVAGIELGPNVVQKQVPCADGEAVWVEPDRAEASALAIKPRYLPPGAKASTAEAIECRGEIISNYRTYSLAVDENGLRRVARGEVSFFDVRHGGVLEIFKSTGGPSFSSGIPAYRWEERSINGHTVALARPLIDRGFGESMVIAHDGHVLTFIRAIDLSVDELVLVAEGIIGNVD